MSMRCMSRNHVPECPPDIEWPVEPKPPREVEDPDPVDVMPVPLRPDDVSAVETDVGARPLEKMPWRFEDEREFQLQLPHER